MTPESATAANVQQLVPLLDVTSMSRSLELYERGLGFNLEPQRPFVGNRMWVVLLQDPDGYRVFFESQTDVPEETLYSEAEHGRP